MGFHELRRNLEDAASREQRIRELAEQLHRRGLAMTKESARQLAESLVATERKVQQRYQEKKAAVTRYNDPRSTADQRGTTAQQPHFLKSPVSPAQSESVGGETKVLPGDAGSIAEVESTESSDDVERRTPESEHDEQRFESAHGAAGGADGGVVASRSARDVGEEVSTTPDARDEEVPAQDTAEGIVVYDVPERNEVALPEEPRDGGVEEEKEGKDAPEVLEERDSADAGEDGAEGAVVHGGTGERDSVRSTTEETAGEEVASEDTASEEVASEETAGEEAVPGETSAEETSGEDTSGEENSSEAAPDALADEKSQREDLGKKHGINISEIFNVHK